MNYTNLTGLFRAFGVAMDERQMAKIRDGKSWEAHSFSGAETVAVDSKARDRNFYTVSFVVASYGMFDRLTTYELRFHQSGHDGAEENWNIKFHGHDDHGYKVDKVVHKSKNSDHETTVDTWVRHPNLTRVGRVFNAVAGLGAHDHTGHSHGGHDDHHDHGHEKRRLFKLDDDSAQAMLCEVREFDATCRKRIYETGRVGVDVRPEKQDVKKTPAKSPRP